MTREGAGWGEIGPGEEGELTELAKHVSLKAGKQAQTASLQV